MRVVIRQKDLDITPALAEFIETKLVKPIARRLKKIGATPLLELEIGRSTRHHRKGNVYHAEANLTIKGVLLRAEADNRDARSACGLLENELVREITKYKNKIITISQKRARIIKQRLGR